jgi:preprotein translocase subunit SecG
MKKFVAILTALMFALSLGVAVAEEKAPAPAEKKEMKKAKKAKKEKKEKAAEAPAATPAVPAAK